MEAGRSQDGLQEEQYSPKNVRAYEAIYGTDFVSPGGKAMARRLLSELDLQPNRRVLDVGSGLGGSVFLLAEEFDALPTGIDLSPNMVAEATRRSRLRGLGESVNFRNLDCLELDESEAFDLVVSRDVFLHIHDKERLMSVLFRALKPGGQIYFTDYCCKPKPWPWSFSAYVDARKYALHTLEEYQAYIRGAGFDIIEARDITDLFAHTLSEELSRLKGVRGVGWATRTGLRMAWKMKLNRARSGVHRWGLFRARKPL